MRYLVDPRVVTGTSWITGADQKDRHVFNLVAGRDFTPDGVLTSPRFAKVIRLLTAVVNST
ncbi:prolyl-tRNA synthetase [Cutibacterium acnes JCM 18918]|nr:prolyl-tRNA synthetase [Cutibacterium acnes JCM 18918]